MNKQYFEKATVSKIIVNSRCFEADLIIRLSNRKWVGSPGSKFPSKDFEIELDCFAHEIEDIRTLEKIKSGDKISFRLSLLEFGVTKVTNKQKTILYKKPWPSAVNSYHLIGEIVDVKKGEKYDTLIMDCGFYCNVSVDSAKKIKVGDFIELGCRLDMKNVKKL
jgi:hypothetical protein